MNGEEIRRDSESELRKRMKELMEPDMYENDSVFYRFLKARNFNVDQAEAMLKNHLEWRKENDVKNIHKNKSPEVLTKYFPYTLLGYDKEGSPVRYIAAGNIDWIGIIYSVKEENLMKHMICNYEEDLRLCKEMTVKLGKTVEKCVQIIDFDNFSFANATNKKNIKYSISVFNMYQNNYPETLKSCYAINASMYFRLGYAAVKLCLARSILEKVRIYYDDSYKEDLLKSIDADVLPAFLGGTRTDPDGNVMCKTFIDRGRLIPERYYIHRNKRPLSSEPGVQKVTLKRAAFHQIVLEVKEACSHLEWKFETKSRDIGFGLFYQQLSSDGEQNNVEIIPISRIDTEEFAETGLYLCEKAGTYVVVFDNSYSWMRSKKLFYRINILRSGKHEYEV